MLRVKTQLAPSKIHGLGVFADEPIRAGQTVWELDQLLDLRISDLVFAALPAQTQAYIRRHCYVNYGAPHEFVMCFDDARFINFAANPSLQLANDNTPNSPLIAARDIAVWDELTVGKETDADYARKMNIFRNAEDS